jgi:hypothetical protein
MKTVLAKQHLLNLFDSKIDTSDYYVVVGGYTPWSNEVSPPPVVHTQKNIANVRKESIYGLKIGASDSAFLVKRNAWVTGTVYDQYEYDSEKAFDNNFFIINSDMNVYKCIHNNYDKPSTVEPVSKTTNVFFTSDGYAWKYLYTITQSDMTKFGTISSIPVTPNTSITAAAVRGTIEYVEVVNGGDNWLIYNTGTIQRALSTNTYQLENTANPVEDIYIDSALYVSAGTGAGNVRKIIGSSSNSSGKFITVDSNLTLSNNSVYTVGPRVVVDGDGSGFLAYSTVSNNTIVGINVLNPGSNYTFANISLVTSNNYGSAVEFKPLVSPQDGHGSNPAIELNSTNIGIYAKFPKNVSTNVLPNTNFSYRQFSVMYAPTFQDANTGHANAVFVSTATTTKPFNVGDTIKSDTSHAAGYVYWSNSTHIKMSYVSNNFIEGEGIINQNDQLDIITNVTNPNIVYNTGKIVYFYNNTPINRSDNISETLKFTLDLEG